MGPTTHHTIALLPHLAAHHQPPAAPAAPPPLLEFVDFKWLMAGEGHRVDLDRLQREPAYARGCLAVAGGSTSSTLRQAADRLARGLGAVLAGPVLPGPALQCPAMVSAAQAASGL